jgi:LPXTG-motif cell wall-anchored protein
MKDLQPGRPATKEVHIMTTMRRKSKSKNLGALLLALALILSFALSPIFGSAKAASVPPIEHVGNIEIGYTVYPPVGGTYDDTGYGTLTITSTDGITFDWLFDSDPAGDYNVTAVYVKGGNAYNEYNYGANGSLGDTDLVSPTMPNSNVPAISHICFVFGSTPKGALQVTKIVAGIGAPDTAFSITISGQGYSDTQNFNYIGQDVSYTWTGLTPGSYTITEGPLGTEWTVEVPAESITVVAGQTANSTVTNTYSAGGGGSTPVIAIDKSADDYSLPKGGGTVVFTYTLTNPGTVPLQNVDVSDDKIADDDIAFSSGDTDDDGLLDPSETWIFKATVEISETTTNVATATGSDEQGNPATPKYDDVTVTVRTGNGGSGDNGGGNNGGGDNGDNGETIITEEIPVVPPAAPPTPTEPIVVAAPLPAVSPISLPKTGAGNALMALAGLMALGAGVITCRIRN